jgi:CheY-like chemotaxis protein
MRRILIIEDEAVLRSSLVRGLAAQRDWIVVGASTVADGLRAIDEAPPDILLTDIDLPDRSGLELLGELGQRGLTIPVVFMSAYLKAYGAQIPRHANVHVLEKPVGLEQLRTVVRSRLGGDVSTSPFSLPDYLQLACMGQHSVRITVPDHEGEVIVYRGVLWTARDTKGEGKPAFQRLALSDSMAVHCDALEGSPPPRTVDEDWQRLLLDTARLTDEGVDFDQEAILLDNGAEGEAGAPAEAPAEAPTEAPTEAPVEASADSADDMEPARDLTHAVLGSDLLEVETTFSTAKGPSPLEIELERAAEAILDKDYVAARAALTAAAALAPEDPRVVANLRRLDELGR